MTLVQLMLDGTLAAAELLALLLVPPATGPEPAALDAPLALERSVPLHRLSTLVEVRLPGSPADVRVARAVGNVSSTTVRPARQLPFRDPHLDRLRLAHGGHTVDLLPCGACGDIPTNAHVRLTEDERIADALRFAPGTDAALEAIAAHPLEGHGRNYRLRLAVPVPADVTPAMLIDDGDGLFLLLVPHRAARHARLVLRPRTGESEVVEIGAIGVRHAVVVPLPSHADPDGLADGVIELDLEDDRETWWTTLRPSR